MADGQGFRWPLAVSERLYGEGGTQSPGLWIGLGFAAAFLAAAVRLRRYRDPI